MSCEIIDQIRIGGPQNFDRYEPCRYKHKNSEVNTFLSRYRRYKYRFVIDNLLFSSVLRNNTNVIFVVVTD